MALCESMMNEEPVNLIRDSTRKLLYSHRRALRDEETNLRRHIENSSTTPETIQGIVSKLKTKLPVSAAELKSLKNGVMDDSKYIEVVLNTHGALRGLVRELSGHNVKKQCEAAGCLCNLALGDSKTGVTIAKAAGPYLIAALDSLSAELAVTSAWALGNIAGSGPRACQLLTAQGAAKLQHLLLSSCEDLRSAAVYSLLHYLRNVEGEISSDQLTIMLKGLSSQELDLESSQLLFILSCHSEFNSTSLSERFLHKILQELTVSIDQHISKCRSAKNCCRVVYLIRTLANLEMRDDLHEFLENYFVENNVSKKFRVLLTSDNDVSKALLWFLGNLFNYKGDNIFFHSLLN